MSVEKETDSIYRESPLLASVLFVLVKWLRSLLKLKHAEPSPVLSLFYTEKAEGLVSSLAGPASSVCRPPLPLSDAAVHTEPLVGLPAAVTVDGVKMMFGPHMPARRAAVQYCQSAGIKPSLLPRVYAKLDKARSTEIARLYEEMEATPSDPDTRAAYEALAAETLAQWQVIKATGLRVEFSPEGSEPYRNPRRAILDVTQHNHLFVTPTRGAYGDCAFVPDPDNPLLDEVPAGEPPISGAVPLVNDIFRIVHDYFGHIREGLGFRAEGEENAWRGHAAMYSPLARRAMTTELRGQNSWINFGPYGETNRRAGMGETRFAPQKLALLPEWVSVEGMADPTGSTV